MKKLLLIVITLIFIPILSWGEGEYAEKVILSAKWGTGEGEFGIHREPAGEYSVYGPEMRRAPMCLKVKGNFIYILDGENQRVQKFSKDGKYISLINTSFKAVRMNIDEDGEIFTYSIDEDIENGGRIERFNSNGEKAEEFKVNPKDVRTNDGVYTNEGKLYSKYDGKLIGKIKNKQVIKKSSLKLWKNTYSSGLERLKISETKNSRKYFLDRYFLEDSINSIVHILYGIGDKYNPDYEIDLIDTHGKLIKTLAVHGNYYQLNRGMANNYFEIDENGNIYQLWTTEKGVFVSIWTK